MEGWSTVVVSDTFGPLSRVARGPPGRLIYTLHARREGAAPGPPALASFHPPRNFFSNSGAWSASRQLVGSYFASLFSYKSLSRRLRSFGARGLGLSLSKTAACGRPRSVDALLSGTVRSRLENVYGRLGRARALLSHPSNRVVGVAARVARVVPQLAAALA